MAARSRNLRSTTTSRRRLPSPMLPTTRWSCLRPKSWCKESGLKKSSPTTNPHPNLRRQQQPHCKQDEEGHVTTHGYNTSNQKIWEIKGQGGSCTAPPRPGRDPHHTYQYLSPTHLRRDSVTECIPGAVKAVTMAIPIRASRSCRPRLPERLHPFGGCGVAARDPATTVSVRFRPSTVRARCQRRHHHHLLRCTSGVPAGSCSA